MPQAILTARWRKLRRMRKLRILLADDHETVREGLKVILNAQPDMEVVAEASDGNAAISKLRPSRLTSW